jgi:lipopolysaccharide biosynthesis regulator YciM
LCLPTHLPSEAVMSEPLKKHCIQCGYDYSAKYPDCPSCYDFSYLTELDPFTGTKITLGGGDKDGGT